MKTDWAIWGNVLNLIKVETFGVTFAFCLLFVTESSYSQEVSVQSGSSLLLSTTDVRQLNSLSDAQLTTFLNSLAAIPLIPASNLTGGGTFLSLQNPSWPPLPGDMNGLPAWSFNGFYLLDDLDWNYSAEPYLAMGMRAMDAGAPFPGTGGTGGSSMASYFPISLDTNLLWLNLTNVSNGQGYGNLFNATDQVYAVWSTTNLLSSWQVETEVWPTDTNRNPFVIQTAGRPNLFLQAEDWTSVTNNGNVTPDWWFWEYFGTTALSDTDVDADGNTLVSDYQDGQDPNVIDFSVSLGNQNFNTNPAVGSFTVNSGIPSYEAVLVNDTNLNDAVWKPYNGVVTLPLGATDGVYQVEIGLKGRAPSSLGTWLGTSVTLKQTGVTLVITNPVENNPEMPYIQLQGYATSPIASVSYDISNALGVAVSQPGYITGQYLDFGLLQFTTNYFMCCDVPLAVGCNAISIHAIDLAGNLTTLTTNYFLDYSAKTNSPQLEVKWPAGGMQLVTTNITVCGFVSDPTALVSLQVTDDAGDTNVITADVERDGHVWVQNVPLGGMTNILTLTAQDIVSNITTVTLTVTLNTNEEIDNISVSGDLWESTANISGTSADPDATITVNGVLADSDGEGDWSANNVPVPEGNMASFHAEVTPPGGTPNYANLTTIKQSEIKLNATTYSDEIHDEAIGSGTNTEDWGTSWSWSKAAGGFYRSFLIGYGSDISTNKVVFSESTTGNILPDRSINSVYYENSMGQAYVTSTNVPGGAWQSDMPQTIGSENAIDPRRNYDSENISGKADWILHTGGLSEANRMGLFELSASVMLQSPVYYFLRGIFVNNTNLPASEISFIGQQLQAGYLGLTQLPNGVSVDAPIITDKPLGVAGGAETKYDPSIVVSCNGKSFDLSSNTPDFCVGQSLTFDISGLPSRIYNLVARWTLPGTFVNTNSDPNCDLFYEENTAFLNPPQGTSATSCWYIKNGQSLSVSVQVYYRYSTCGKIESEVYKGQFNIHRPTSSEGVPYQPDGEPTAQISGNFLSLGITGITNDMSFDHQIQTDEFCSGQVGYVQLITAVDIMTHPSSSQLHGIALDNSLGEFARGNPSITENASTNVKFYDAPAVQLSDDLSPVSEANSYSTYLMFKPDSGIWVPLRIITWDLSDEANYESTGWATVNTPNAKPAKILSDVDSYSFPHWTSKW